MKVSIKHSRGSRSYDRAVRRVINSTARIASFVKEPSVAVVFIEDRKMRELNRKYRGKDKTTNVLAFATSSQFTVHSSQLDLGDIFISVPEAKREAKKYGWTMQYAVARLSLHGFLHLLGYDHIKDKEARKMEKIESKVLRNF